MHNSHFNNNLFHPSFTYKMQKLNREIPKNTNNFHNIFLFSKPSVKNISYKSHDDHYIILIFLKNPF